MRTTLSGILLLLACSCSSTPPSRLETDPPGARLLFVDHNLELPTPTEFSGDYDVDEPVRVSKDGYQTWEGTLGDLTRSGERTYRLKLQARR